MSMNYYKLSRAACPSLSHNSERNLFVLSKNLLAVACDQMTKVAHQLSWTSIHVDVLLRGGEKIVAKVNLKDQN